MSRSPCTRLWTRVPTGTGPGDGKPAQEAKRDLEPPGGPAPRGRPALYRRFGQGRRASAATRAEIVSLTQELFDALTRGDAAVWQRLLVDDAIVVDEFARLQDKREAVRVVTPLPRGFSGSIALLHPQVRQFGDAAIIECEADEKESVFDQRLAVRYRFVATWVRRGGAWRLATMADVTVPTEPPELAVPGLRLDDYPGTYRYGLDRAWIVRRSGDHLVCLRRTGGREETLRPVAVDVFSEGSDEKNLLVFQRDTSGRVVRLVERRKYNDLTLKRE